MGDRARQSSQRRSTDPYREHRHHDHHQHHQHTQPRYAETPAYPSRRRHTEPKSSGTGLTRVHSRPEDYKNKPRPDKLFSYICFDDQGHPQECDEVKESQSQQSQASPKSHAITRESKPKCKGEHVETKVPLHQVDSYSSHEWSRTDDSGDEGDSEEELTLPSMYHHDVAQKDDQWFNSHNPQSRSPERSRRTDKTPRTDVQHEQRRRDSPPASTAHRRASASPPSPSSRRTSPTTVAPRSRANAPSDGESQSSLPNAEMLIAKVAEHLQAHKDEYGHAGTKQLVNELLGEVVRKVADGSLDTSLVKDVVREVQHVL